MLGAASTDLPVWARVSPGRAAHIARVTTMLMTWADAMAIDRAEAEEWRDAGRWHDALRDAPEAELRALTGDGHSAAALLHGPAAAIRLEADGERRAGVLDAVAHHTVGHPHWSRTGRALYMADYLEPGRPFKRPERAALAAQAPHDFDATFREVVRQRFQWSQEEGVEMHPQTTALWDAVK